MRIWIFCTSHCVRCVQHFKEQKWSTSNLEMNFILHNLFFSSRIQWDKLFQIEIVLQVQSLLINIWIIEFQPKRRIKDGNACYHHLYQSKYFQQNDNSGFTAIAIIFTFQEIQIDSQKTFVIKTTTTNFYSNDFARTNNSYAYWAQCMFFPLHLFIFAYIFVCIEKKLSIWMWYM